MFVKLKINLGYRDYPKVESLEAFTEGTTHEVADAVGKLIVSRGHGVEVEGSPAKSGKKEAA